jgi:hypothetical protein
MSSSYKLRPVGYCLFAAGSLAGVAALWIYSNELYIQAYTEALQKLSTDYPADAWSALKNTCPSATQNLTDYYAYCCASQVLVTALPTALEVITLAVAGVVSLLMNQGSQCAHKIMLFLSVASTVGVYTLVNSRLIPETASDDGYNALMCLAKDTHSFDHLSDISQDPLVSLPSSIMQGLGVTLLSLALSSAVVIFMVAGCYCIESGRRSELLARRAAAAGAQQTAYAALNGGPARRDGGFKPS